MTREHRNHGVATRGLPSRQTRDCTVAQVQAQTAEIRKLMEALAQPLAQIETAMRRVQEGVDPDPLPVLSGAHHSVIYLRLEATKLLESASIIEATLRRYEAA